MVRLCLMLASLISKCYHLQLKLLCVFIGFCLQGIGHFFNLFVCLFFVLFLFFYPSSNSV